jgi:hypothetical protein
VYKKILILVLLCFSIKTYAVKWVEVAEIGDTIYVDIESINKNRGFVFYSSLSNIASMGLNSVIIKNKADCEDNIIIELNTTFFGQSMGRGISYEEDSTVKEEIHPRPNTTKYEVMKFACGVAK